MDEEGIVLRAQLLSADGAEEVAEERRFGRGEESGAEALSREMLAHSPESIRALFAN